MALTTENPLTTADLPIAPNTPAKTTNCRFCQHFGGPCDEKVSREATQGQISTTNRFGI